ncbi:DUF317 domain-containing protein [Streptomyces globisporus]|uniref:DUF317 domain-containing protein n=1 Tax=Streptomyces globisporus TaxID=1908 RepID=UPI00345F833E
MFSHAPQPEPRCRRPRPLSRHRAGAGDGGENERPLAATTASACAPAAPAAAYADPFSSFASGDSTMYAPDDPTRYQEVLVSPMYLAGSNGTGEAGFAPVAHWPHQYLDEGPCQLLVTSPDQRIRIGWFGNDFELWKISAVEDAFSAPRWTATFNHVTPAEMVAGLTAALVQDYDEAIASDTPGRFLTGSTVPWRDTVRPLTDAGWNLDGAAELGTVEIIAPDDQAGILVDRRGYGSDRTTVELWPAGLGHSCRSDVHGPHPVPLDRRNRRCDGEVDAGGPRAPPSRPADAALGHDDPCRFGHADRRGSGFARSDSAGRTPHRGHPGRTPCRAGTTHGSRTPGDGRAEPLHGGGAETDGTLGARALCPAAGQLADAPARTLTPTPGRTPLATVPAQQEFHHAHHARPGHGHDRERLGPTPRSI